MNNFVINDMELDNNKMANYTLKREYGKTPNGNNLDGRWVLRINGEFIDFDQYRNDIIERIQPKIQCIKRKLK